MRNQGIVQEILNFIPTIDFTRTSTTASLFETTVGRAIGTYELLLTCDRFVIWQECYLGTIYSRDH